jgi:hypothetical protein
MKISTALSLAVTASTYVAAWLHRGDSALTEKLGTFETLICAALIVRKV